MKNHIIKPFVRSLFTLTSRERALAQCKAVGDQYLALSNRLPSDKGRHHVRVPPMPGVDEDMRNWSFFMVLEHNTIVNRSITAMVSQLARGEAPKGAAAINPKTDVMPSPLAGPEQLAAFRISIDRHLQVVKGLGRLRGTRASRHPMFGNFDAHKWHCMFAFHLKVHFPQAKYVAHRAMTR